MSASPKEAATEKPDDDVEAPAGPAKSGDTDPLIGKVISDRFRIIAPIARGGMGVVYKAEQAPLGRLVAIKILSLKHDEQKDPEFRKRFFLEAATVAKLTHPNTVTVFDYGQGDAGKGSPGFNAQGIYYIAMELVNGRTLKKVLSEEGPFSGPRTINVVMQICRSLREAHRLGVIHRDMKPGNVMLVDRDGEDYVKVLDFGLVKEVGGENELEEDLTQAGVFMGSPKYMAPEQIQGEHVDGRSDIYAIGVMMYEMLCGRVPFHRDNPMQILMDHVREPVPPMTVPAGMAPIPPELQAVVFRCLEKKKEQRYANMEALLVALKNGAGEGVAIQSSQSRELDLSLATGTPVSGIHSVGPQIVGPQIVGPHSPAMGMPTGSLASGSLSVPSPAPASKMPMVLAGLIALAAVGGVAAFALTGGPSDTPAEPRDAPVVAAPPRTDVAEVAPDQVAPGQAPPTTDTPAIDTAGAASPDPVVEAPVHTLMLDLRSSPPGATVRIGDREYGPTPTRVELVGELAAQGTELEMVFERAGYRSTTMTETVEGERLEVNARLTLIRRPGGGGGAAAGGAGDTHVEGYRDSPY